MLWLCSVGGRRAAIYHMLVPVWAYAGNKGVLSAPVKREMAYFDIGFAGIFIWTAHQGDLALKRGAMLVLCGLSFALGLNHLEGCIQDAKIFHVIFFVANFLAVLWSGTAFLNRACFYPEIDLHVKLLITAHQTTWRHCPSSEADDSADSKEIG